MIDNKKEAVLVVGGDSTIGGAMVTRLDRIGLPVVWTTRRRDELSDRSLHIDLDDESCAWNLPDVPPASAVLCAAITSVEACELNPGRTGKVNVENTVKLAKILRASGAFVTILSTDMVFDGLRPLVRSDQATTPVTQYGRQKADVEKALCGHSNDVAVVRLGKVIGPQTSPFTEWIEDLSSGVAIHPFSDVVLAPISLDCVVGLLVGITTNRRCGIFHATGPTDITYADAAYWIADRMGVDDRLVVPVPRKYLPGDLRPIHRALDVSMDLAEMGLTGIDSLQELFCV